jgi:hypothetical protein
MPPVNDFLKQIALSHVNVNILNDARASSPGGTMVLDLSRGRAPFATLAIRSIHPSDAEFPNPDSYLITEVTIDSAEVITIRKPTDASLLWLKVNSLIENHQHRPPPFQSYSRYQQRPRHSRYRARPSRFTSVTGRPFRNETSY